MVGRGLPGSLRVFLLTLAIVDDLGAVALIAIFYTGRLHPEPLLGAAAALGAMVLLGRMKRPPALLYAGAFLLVWAFTLESGVSTSLAGVAAAFTVPVASRIQGVESPLKNFMETLHPYVAFGVLPLFAFAAAGFSFDGLTLQGLLAPVTLGVALGLFLGKQVGVLGAAGAAVRLGLARRPSGATWSELYGVAVLCGVGFTMSLFLGALAFAPPDPTLQTEVKLGVLAGSVLSILVGAAVLARASRIRLGRSAAADEG
jgi:NhaA family Na+:H+ antiporter